MSSDKKTILVVDDEKDILEVIVDALTTVPGRKVIIANSPSEAYMRSVGTKFDLMITDFRMPKTSGADLIKVIRGQKQNTSVPILLISGYPDEAVIKLKDIPDVHVMAKPFMINDLQKKVDELLSTSSKNTPNQIPNQPLVFDVNILNDFIASTGVVIRTLTGMQEIKTEKAFIYNKDTEFNVDISGLIQIQTEKFKGTVVLSFPQATFLKLVNGFTKENHASLSSENEGHAASILTLIKNHATESLETKKIFLLGSALQIITGAKHRIGVFEQQTTLVIPIKALIGDFYLFASVG